MAPSRQRGREKEQMESAEMEIQIGGIGGKGHGMIEGEKRNAVMQ